MFKLHGPDRDWFGNIYFLNQIKSHEKWKYHQSQDERITQVNVRLKRPKVLHDSYCQVPAHFPLLLLFYALLSMWQETLNILLQNKICLFQLMT